MLKALVLITVAMIAVLSSARAQKAPAPLRSFEENISNSRAAVPRPNVQTWEQIDQRLKSLDDKASNTSSGLSEIQKQLNKPKTLSLIDLAPALVSALAGILGVLVGIFSTQKQQRERLTQEAALAQVKADNDLRLAERQSKATISSAVVDWQFKQLFLLYGPLKALLDQSFSLYRQMNTALCRASPEKFRLVPSSNHSQASEDNQEFQILIDNKPWTRFRVVMHMHHIYGQGFEVELYIDEVVAIGARIVTIIQDKAGYARPEEAELMRVFGRYLAHFAVMDHQHKVAKQLHGGGDEQAGKNKFHLLLSVDSAAVFPLELPSLINTGFSAITRDIEEWKKKMA